MLDIHNISKSYKGKFALENVSLHLKKGSCFGLIGPNGAGKSTLMKIIPGIITSDNGMIRMKNTSRQIGYVPQELCLEETLSAQQNLHFFGKVSGLKRSTLREKVIDVLSVIGLSEHATDKIETFSGGMKRRLNIGCALMSEPDLIVLDEPTVGIDPESRQDILQLVNQMKQENKTIIYSTHYMEEAEKVCDEVAFLNHGKVIKQTAMANLLESNAVPELFFQLKEQQNHLIDPSLFGEVENCSNGYLLATENPIQTIEHIIHVCKEHQLELAQLEITKSRLEDIFFQLTGNKLQEH